jgi:hypothetical protein
MTITEWLKIQTAAWNNLADAVDRLRASPQLDVQIRADDTEEADAIKRGQRPALLDALRRML